MQAPTLLPKESSQQKENIKTAETFKHFLQERNLPLWNPNNAETLSWTQDQQHREPLKRNQLRGNLPSVRQLLKSLRICMKIRPGNKHLANPDSAKKRILGTKL